MDLFENKVSPNPLTNHHSPHIGGISHLQTHSNIISSWLLSISHDYKDPIPLRLWLVYFHGISPTVSRQSIVHWWTLPFFPAISSWLSHFYPAHMKLLTSPVPHQVRSLKTLFSSSLRRPCCQEEEGLRSPDPGLRCSGRGQSHRHHLSCWSLRRATWELEKLLLSSLVFFFNMDWWEIPQKFESRFCWIFFLGDWGLLLTWLMEKGENRQKLKCMLEICCLLAELLSKSTVFAVQMTRALESIWVCP